MLLSDLPTPQVLIDHTRAMNNIARVQALATGAGVQLRPHAKTHKSPIVARWQIDAGAVGIACAKIGEAEVFVDAGISNIGCPTRSTRRTRRGCSR
jgi:3-hydroxy-D-aspartate aldolase